MALLSPPPAGAHLTTHAVVRLVPLGRAVPDCDLTRAEALLDPAELARARCGTDSVRRRRVLLRAALRTALGDELGVDPRTVPLTADPAGRPRLPAATGLDASASASGVLGIVAVTRGARIGVDVERVVPWQDETLDERWLCAAERSALARVPASQRAEAAARAWTQKEAVLKGRGTGLREDPAAVGTTVGAADGVVAGWRVSAVPVPTGWVASLALAPMEEWA